MDLCPICKQDLPHDFIHNPEDLRLEGGKPVVVTELPIEAISTQPHNVAYNPDGSISVKLSAITFKEMHTSPGGITYLLARAELDVIENHADWHRIDRLTEEKLSAPDLLVVDEGIATFGPGKLGFSIHGINNPTQWVKITLGLHITPEFLLTEEQEANIREVLNAL